MQKKFYLFSFIVIFSCLTLFFFNYTYAKYKDEVTKDANIQIARWNIKVNDETINNKTVLSNDIEPTFDENEYISSGVLAPGASGYYDIIIDTSDCDVAVTYKIIALNSETSTIKDLIITGYEINLDNNKIEYNSSIDGDIKLGDNLTTIRIYIKWNDEANQTMDNIADTEAIINDNSKALIKNTIELTQKK